MPKQAIEVGGGRERFIKGMEDLVHWLFFGWIFLIDLKMLLSASPWGTKAKLALSVGFLMSSLPNHRAKKILLEDNRASETTKIHQVAYWQYFTHDGPDNRIDSGPGIRESDTGNGCRVVCHHFRSKYSQLDRSYQPQLHNIFYHCANLWIVHQHRRPDFHHRHPGELVP